MQQCEYKFGMNKSKCTPEEWKKWSGAIVWVDSDENRKIVPVTCPNCGAINTHKREEIEAFMHYECCLLSDKDGKKMDYECPGYIIMRYYD